MRQYKKKIIFSLIICIISLFVFNTDIDFKVNRYFNSLTASVYTSYKEYGVSYDFESIVTTNTKDETGKLYANTENSIYVTINNIQKVDPDMNLNFKARILYNGVVVTNKFTYENISYNHDEKVIVKITMNDNEYNVGKYDLYVYHNTSVDGIKSEFDVVGKYYNYNINASDTSSLANPRQENTWNFDVVDATNIDPNYLSLKITNSSGIDVTNSYFNVSKTASKFTVKNYYFASDCDDNVCNKNIPDAGKYSIRIKYAKPAYSTSNPTEENDATGAIYYDYELNFAETKITVANANKNGASYESHRSLTNLSFDYSTLNKTVLYNKNGKFIFKYKFADFYNSNEFRTATYSIIRLSDNKTMNTGDGFTYDNPSFDTSTQVATFNLYYRAGTNGTNYVSNYIFRINFTKSSQTIDIPFNITKDDVANIDYFFSSRLDKHETSDVDALEDGVNPPGNKKYEYYLGLELFRGSNKETTLPNKEFNIRIFNKKVGANVGADGKLGTNDDVLYFYDETPSTVQIKSYLNGNVTLLNNGVSETISLTNFKQQYADANNMFSLFGAQSDLGLFNFDASGNIISDKLNTHITYYKMQSGIPTLKYVTGSTFTTLNETTVTGVAAVNNFAKTHSDEYVYAVINADLQTGLVPYEKKYIDATQFRIIYNIFNGQKRNILSGNINDYEVTDKFSIEINDGANDETAAITMANFAKILPKTEVAGGKYYVYVGYGSSYSLGYINNKYSFCEGIECNSFDETTSLPISKTEYPEMFYQNTHHSTIEYANPDYTAEIDRALTKISNKRNNKDELYYNVDGTIELGTTLNYIYNILNGNNSRISYKVYNSSSVDVTSAFEIENPFTYNNNETKQLINGVLTNVEVKDSITETARLNYKANELSEGNYHVSLYYDNQKLFDYDFSLNKYVGLAFEKQTVEFVKNYSMAQEIKFKGYYLDSPLNFNMKLDYTGAVTETELGYDNLANGHFYENSNNWFDYELTYEDKGNDETDYILSLTNLTDNAKDGKYELTLTYNGTSDKFTFYIAEDTYLLEIGDEKAYVDLSGMHYQRKITTKYFYQSNLDNLLFSILNDDEKDVSSQTANPKMFSLNRDLLNVDCSNKPYCEQTLDYTLNIKEVDLDASYDFKARYNTINYPVDTIPIQVKRGTSLGDIYKLNVKNSQVIGYYKGEEVTGFYNNLDRVDIKIDLDTVFDKSVTKIVVSTDCTDPKRTCSPKSAYSEPTNVFSAPVWSADGKSVTLTANDPSRLRTGKYSIIIYYRTGQSDIDEYAQQIYTRDYFTVKDKYVDIKFGTVNIKTLTESGGEVDQVFANRKSEITVPLEIKGLSYNQNLFTLSKNGGGNYINNFTIESDCTAFSTKCNMKLKYNGSGLSAGNYQLLASYEGITYDELPITIYENYYNFEITKREYTPEVLASNIRGKVTYTIETDNMVELTKKTINKIAEEMVKNVSVTPFNSLTDITKKFIIDYEVIDRTTFKVNLTFMANVLDENGSYLFRIFYDYNNYRLERGNGFDLGLDGEYISVYQIVYESITSDNKIHNNIGGNILISYLSIKPIDPDKLIVSIIDKNGMDVSNYFDGVTSPRTDGMTLSLKTDDLLPKGQYEVVFNYTNSSGEVKISSCFIDIEDFYQEIKLKNLQKSNTKIYADIDGHYTYEFEKIGIDDTVLVYPEIYDSYKNLVYSKNGILDTDLEGNVTLSTDNNKFDVQKIGDNKYQINIKPLKANVGAYYVVMKTEDLKVTSNKLNFTIDDNYYLLKIKKSTIKSIVDYGDNKIYDTKGFNAKLEYESSYNKKDISVGIFKNNKLYRNITDFIISDKEVSFSVNSISSGTYDIALCVKGHIYDSVKITVNRYIKTNALSINIDNQITTNYKLSINKQYKVTLVVAPSAATDKNFKYTVGNPKIISYQNGILKTLAAGKTTLTVKNGDITHTVNIEVVNRISSNVYKIDYTKKIIYVNKMTKYTLPYQTFVNNMQQLSKTFKIYNANNVAISKTTNIGTGMTLENDGEKYKIVVIGDINGDGKVSLADVAYLFQYVRKKIKITDTYKLKAADIRKQDNITLADVAKLFQFIRNRIKEI